MMLDQIRNLTYQMRLFGIHEACERRAQEALSQQLHPLEFLRLILEDEALSRKDRTAKALTTKAYCAMYNLTQGRYVAPFVILTLQGLTLELKEGNNGRVHHGTTIQAGVFTIHL